MSTLIKENGKTQEEMDVESQVKNSKAAPKPIEKPVLSSSSSEIEIQP